MTSLEALTPRLRALLRQPGRAILGITGPPGAGKSTLAGRVLVRLADEFGPEAVAHLPMDGFHLADVQLERLGNRDRKGAPDTFDVAGFVAALQRIRAAEPGPIYVPGFERTLEQPIAAALVIDPRARLVVTEGNYLLWDRDGWQRVASYLSQTWYVDLDPAVRRERLIRRHVEFGKSLAEATEWVLRSDEANADLVASTRSRADLCLTG